MRYFYIAFVHNDGFGSLCFESDEDRFPSLNGLTQDMKEENPNLEGITILNVLEFKNKEDYDSFNDNE